MFRPTRLVIEPSALLHNVAQVRRYAPHSKIIAMVKANAYGCGIRAVAPVLNDHVDALGVACLEEALLIRSLGVDTPCILVQGVFSPDELQIAVHNRCEVVIHQAHQLAWIEEASFLDRPVKLWVKVNTGLHRLGFKPQESSAVIQRLLRCPWVDPDIGLLTHMACADEPDRTENKDQMTAFEGVDSSLYAYKSMANSASIIVLPETHFDYVRPGIMLYGVSPFANQTGLDVGLMPVMRFISKLSAINTYPADAPIGYSGTWKTSRPSRIGVVPAGYGDGYPRHIKPNTPIWVKDREVSIVGRVSMDMVTVDLTDHPDLKVGDPVELWGIHLPVERIAHSAGTSGYELLCQITGRVLRD